MFKKTLTSILFSGLVALGILVTPLKAFSAAEFDMNNSLGPVIDDTRSPPKWHRADGITLATKAQKAVIYTKQVGDCRELFFRNYFDEMAGDEIQITTKCEDGAGSIVDYGWGPLFAGGNIDATGDDGIAETSLANATSWTVFYSRENQVVSGDHEACIGAAVGCHIGVALIGKKLTQADVDAYVIANHYEIKLTNPKMPAYDRMPVFNFRHHQKVSKMQLAWVRFGDRDSNLGTSNSQIYGKNFFNLGYLEASVPYNMTYRHSGASCSALAAFPEYDFTTPDFSPDGGNLVASARLSGAANFWQIMTMSRAESNLTAGGGTTYDSCATMTYSDYMAASIPPVAPASSIEFWTSDTVNHEVPHFGPSDFASAYNADGDFGEQLIVYHRRGIDGSGNTRYALATIETARKIAMPGTAYANQILQWSGAETVYRRFKSPSGFVYPLTDRRFPNFAPGKPTAAGGGGGKAISFWIAFEKLDPSSYWQIFEMKLDPAYFTVTENPPAGGGGAAAAGSGGGGGGGMIAASHSATGIKPFASASTGGSTKFTPATGVNTSGVTISPDNGYKVKASSSKWSKLNIDISIPAFSNTEKMKVTLDPNVKGLLHIIDLNRNLDLPLEFQESKNKKLSTESLIKQMIERVAKPDSGFTTLKVDGAKISYKGGSLEKADGLILVQLDKATREAVSYSMLATKKAPLPDLGDWLPDHILVRPAIYIEYQGTKCPNHHFAPEFNNAGLNKDVTPPAPPAVWPPDLAYLMFYHPDAPWDPANPNVKIPAENHRIMYLFDLPAPPHYKCEQQDCVDLGNTDYYPTFDGIMDSDGDGMADRCDACDDRITLTPNAGAPYNYGFLFDGDSDGDFSDTDRSDTCKEATTEEPCPDDDDGYYVDEDGNIICDEEVTSECGCCCCSDGGDTTNNYYYGDTYNYYDTTTTTTPTCTDPHGDGSAMTAEEDANGNGTYDGTLADGTVCETAAEASIDCTVATTTTSLTTTVNDLLLFRDAVMDVPFTTSTGTTYVKKSDGYFWELDSEGNTTGSYLAVSLDVVKSAYEAAMSTSTPDDSTAISATSCPQALSVDGGFQAVGGCGCDMTHSQPLNTQRLVSGILAVLLFTMPIVLLRRRAIEKA